MLEVKDQGLLYAEQCIPCGLAPGVNSLAQLAALESVVELWMSGSFYSAFGGWAWSLAMEGTGQHVWNLDSQSHCRGMDEGLPWLYCVCVVVWCVE